jgi:hypothetical protein
MLGVLAVANTAIGSLNGLRMKFWKDGVWYRSVITPVGGVPATVPPSDYLHFHVDVRNAGARLWPAVGENRVALAYHWYDAAGGQLAVFDGVRSRLPQDVPPGATIRMDATVRAPKVAGRYRLHLDMVHEHTTWFGEQGDAGTDATVEVRTASDPSEIGRPVFTPAVVPPSAAPALEKTTRTALWRAAVLAWRDHPLLGLGPDNFRHVYHRYLGQTDHDDRLHANNLFFETLASLGIAGIAALLLIIIGFAGAARVAIRHHGAVSVAGLLAAGAATGLGAYLVHGFFDYFLEFTPTYALFWLLAGLLSGLAIDRARVPK